MKPFEMAVTDTFRLGDGTTVFVGTIHSGLDLIRPCDCEIIFDSEIKGTIRIDGKMILERKQTPCRSISTRQPIDLSAIGLESGGFTIRSKS
jgi:hypothetical protein